MRLYHDGRVESCLAEMSEEESANVSAASAFCIHWLLRESRTGGMTSGIGGTIVTAVIRGIEKTWQICCGSVPGGSKEEDRRGAAERPSSSDCRFDLSEIIRYQSA